ncbi:MULTISPECIES: hypothetical protein [Corynebacterium]|uniref:hypothetical protein n=1 Tax=Corynebacterium TaxID=1716 RepID=UPI001179C039|nr:MULTISPECIES: hypothetical protein [Corynebacterium]MDK7314517.1 hypothetical protein [Corynebacterium amycolatum]
MVTKDRRAQARRRARELQKEEADRLARMQSARTDAFIALEALDDALESFGLALDKLLDEGEKKGKLAKDFTVPMRRINEALDLVGSSHARKAESERESESDDKADDDTEVVESNSDAVAGEESEANDSAPSNNS